jgi:hypothetical protein
MQEKNLELEALLKHAHSPIQNYIVPGLKSYMIGNEGPNGCIRLFVASREQLVAIAPHNHRYDLVSRVLQGRVLNRIWTAYTGALRDPAADYYVARKLTYKGAPGQYDTEDGDTALYTSSTRIYSASGENSQTAQYSMSHKDIHSIQFSKDAAVLVMQGPDVSASSIVLLPKVDGETCDTAKTEPWMFKRASALL